MEKDVERTGPVLTGRWPTLSAAHPAWAFIWAAEVCYFILFINLSTKKIE
jgi:hypothetical protein